MWARIRDLLHGVGVEVAAACPSKVNWPWRCANWCAGALLLSPLRRADATQTHACVCACACACVHVYILCMHDACAHACMHTYRCTPRTNNGGYAAEKTRYSAAALRAYTVLIETSDSKNPHASTYGSEAVYQHIHFVHACTRIHTHGSGSSSLLSSSSLGLRHVRSRMSVPE